MPIEPYPAASSWLPMPRYPHRAWCRSDDVLPWHPHVLKAIPCPITGLPHIAWSWWQGWSFDNRCRRRNVNHDADTGERRNGQQRHPGAEQREHLASLHPVIQPSEAASALMAVNFQNKKTLCSMIAITAATSSGIPIGFASRSTSCSLPRGVLTRSASK